MSAIRWLTCCTVLIALADVGCNRPNEFVPPPPPEVDAAYPTLGPVSDYLEFTGSTQAVERVEIRPQVTGQLQSIHFEDGQIVKKGDLLFTIEQDPFQATLAVANAELQRANAELALAEAQLERRKPLRRSGTVSQEEYDVAASNVTTAQAAVDSAQASVTQAQLDLRYSEIRAPIAGRIGRRLVDPGNLVQAQTTPLANIETFDPVYAYFNVSDRDVLRLLELEGQYGGRQGANLYLSLDGEEYPYQGKIDWTDLGVDPASRTQLRRGIFPNADGRLLSGLFVRVRLQVAEDEEKVLIEERAVAADQRGTYVLVLNGPGEAPGTVKVEYRPVKLGIASGEKRVVESGLTVDDLIVVNGLQKARPGGSVRLSKSSPTPPGLPAPAPDAAPGSDVPEGEAPAMASEGEVDTDTTAASSAASPSTAAGGPTGGAASSAQLNGGQPSAVTGDAARGASTAPVAPLGGTRTSPSPAGPSQLQGSDDSATRTGS
ncbi:MAG TPA: efflux RND transporter periplasmic adaptor subunit [Pirellulaceae bacterium]|jgi:RND family efflux transporter MFP subunit|nr:efflux RND transporter periplasmic adaptor subunit [Pirellulaceae bacterium]